MIRPRLVLAAVLLCFGACVWEPSHQQNLPRDEPFDVTGWAQNPGTTIRLEAWNYTTNSYQVITTTTSSSDPNFADPSMYFYEFPDVLLPWQNWQPVNACSGSGMASLRVYEGTKKLTTFNATQKQCIFDEVWNGDHPTNAVLDCGTATPDNQLVLFSPPTC